MINAEILTFLKTNCFDHLQGDISNNFGDYVDIWSVKNFELRFSSSKSFEGIDIRASKQTEMWYDLALVKALFYNEKTLNKPTSIIEHMEFLKKEIGQINKLFEPHNYLSTKNRLEEFGRLRAEQMFPGHL